MNHGNIFPKLSQQNRPVYVNVTLHLLIDDYAKMADQGDLTFMLFSP